MCTVRNAFVDVLCMECIHGSLRLLAPPRLALAANIALHRPVTPRCETEKDAVQLGQRGQLDLEG